MRDVLEKVGWLRLIANSVKSGFRAKFIAGFEAEYLFRQQATAQGLILERIDQRPLSFLPYRNVAKVAVKRGDFICRNCRNAEIEVKCLRLYGSPNDPYYLLPYRQYKKHMAMKAMTKSALFLAIYTRQGRTPQTDSLRMMEIGVWQALNQSNEGLYDEKNKCIRIPRERMLPGFLPLRQGEKAPSAGTCRLRGSQDRRDEFPV